MDKGYPRDLAWKTTAELDALHLHLDEFGRIRDRDGAYVCALTGHAHLHYLRAWPIPEPEHKFRTLWVCDHALEESVSHAVKAVVERATAIVGERQAKAQTRGILAELGEFFTGRLIRVVFGG